MNYKLNGTSLQSVTVELEEGEAVYSSPHAMYQMSANTTVETTMKGGFSKSLRRAISGEAFAMTVFTASKGTSKVSFAGVSAGAIIPLEIEEGKEYVCQAELFVAAKKGVELDLFVQKKKIGGFFSGNGLIMQKLKGTGTAFIEIDGEAEIIDLEEGEEIYVDPSHLAIMEASVGVEFESVAGYKKGLLCKLTGKGKVWLQSFPMVDLAEKIKLINQSKLFKIT